MSVRTIRTSIVILLLAAAGCGEPPGQKPGTNRPGGDAGSGAKTAPVGSAAERDQTTLFGVEAVDAQNAFAFGTSDSGISGSVILKTTDGGAHWASVLRTALTEIVSLDFVDARNGTAITDGGSVYETSDGGATWKASNDSGLFTQRFATEPAGATNVTDFGVNGISFSGATNGWAFGSREETVPGGKAGRVVTETRSFVVRTTDGGATWKETKVGSGVGLEHGYFADAQNGWIVGGDVEDETPGALFRTTDGGVTWKDVAPNPKQVPEDVHFVDATHGWTIAVSEDESGEPGPTEVYATTDGGATWKSLGKVPATLHAMRFGDARTGWAVGANGKIFVTTDGGAKWTEQTTQDWSGGQSVDITDPTVAGADQPTFTRFVLLAPGHGFAAADLGVYEYRAK